MICVFSSGISSKFTEWSLCPEPSGKYFGKLDSTGIMAEEWAVGAVQDEVVEFGPFSQCLCIGICLGSTMPACLAPRTLHCTGHAWSVFSEHVCPALSWDLLPSSFLGHWQRSLSCPLHSRELSECSAHAFVGCPSQRDMCEIHTLPALSFPIRKTKSHQNSSLNSEDKKRKGK